MQEDRLISLAIAADELEIGHERLRQLAANKLIPAEKRGKLWYLRESVLEDLKKRGKLPPGPKPRTDA